MDRVQLTTIIISAIAGAFAKEAVNWLIASVKALSIIPTAYGKLKRFLSGPYGDILVIIVNLFFFLGILIYFGMSDGTTSRLEIIIVVVSVFMAIIFAAVLLFQIGMARERRRNQNVDGKA